MKKSKIFLVPLVVVAAIMGVMVSNLNNVYAENNTRKECSEEFFKKKYINKIETTVDGNKASFSNVSTGLYYTYGSSEDSLTKGSVAEDGTFEITIPEDGSVVVNFYLKEKESCGAEADHRIGSVIVNQGPGDNQLYNSAACTRYRKYYNDNGKSDKIKKAVSYCFEKTVSVQYSSDRVNAWVDAAITSFEAQKGNITSNITKDENTNIDDVKNVGKLTCDMFSNNNYETMHKYSHVETNSENNCQVTCREDVEINFSDPVETQAGMCFQYLIEIKSKVKCESKYTAPLPTPKAVCVPNAYCYESNGWAGDVGGPSEEFDECISLCDGGKYSKKCIDSCYNKVYGADASKVSNTNTVSNSIFMKRENTFISMAPSKVSNDQCVDPYSVNYYDDAAVRALYESKYRNPGGYYSGNRWIPSGKCASNIGYYYFQSFAMTKKTVGLLKGIIRYSNIAGAYRPASNGSGILKQYYNNTNECSDTCYWVNRCGPDTVLNENQAYVCSNGKNCTYEEALAEYNAAKASCEAKAASCSNEETTYTMTVDNLDGNDSKDDKDNSDWHEEFNANQKLNSTNINGKFKSMVIYAGGVCENNKCNEKDKVDPNSYPQDANECWQYHNIITFPGTWLNNKTMQPVHSIQKGKEYFYTYVGNEYCTKVNSIPVNTAWYDWKVNQDEKVLTDAEKQAIKKQTDMNITGKIENYGYFGWNFNVECFFALIKNPKTDPPSSSPKPNKEYEGDKTKPVTSDFKFRSVSLDNLFPSSEVGTVTRDAGFNWSCDATNIENEDYLVQPVALMNQIQRLGDSIYNDDTYLDYHIELTPKTMKKIRAYNAKAGSYTAPSGSDAEAKGEVLSAGSNKTSGVTVYKSYLLHKVLNSNELKKSGLIGCNNETNGQCQKVAIDDAGGCYRDYQLDKSLLKGE